MKKEYKSIVYDINRKCFRFLPCTDEVIDTIHYKNHLIIVCICTEEEQMSVIGRLEGLANSAIVKSLGKEIYDRRLEKWDIEKKIIKRENDLLNMVTKVIQGMSLENE